MTSYRTTRATKPEKTKAKPAYPELPRMWLNGQLLTYCRQGTWELLRSVKFQPKILGLNPESLLLKITPQMQEEKKSSCTKVVITALLMIEKRKKKMIAKRKKKKTTTSETI